MQNSVLPVSAASHAALQPSAADKRVAWKPLRMLCWKWLVAGSCMAPVVAFAWPARAQETESVGDAARAFRARHSVQGGQETPKQPQSPISAPTLVAWQIAGMATPDILTELQARGIAFAFDDAHVKSFTDAHLAPELLAALPNVPSHPDASSSNVSQALIGAAQAFSTKDYATARRALESLVQQNQDASLFAALGNLDYVSRDLPAAQTAFLRCEQLDPSFVYAHLRLAQVYYRLEQRSQVASEAKQAQRLQPGNAEAHKYLALSATMEADSGGEAPGASGGGKAEDLSDLKAGDDTEAKDLNNKAIELTQQQDWSNAEAAYHRAIELDPKVALYYYNLGVLYNKMGDGHTDDALAAYKKAKALAPRNVAVRQNIGYTMCQSKRYADAVSEFRDLLSIDMYWNMARPCLAESLFGLGRTKEGYEVMKDYTHLKVADDSGDDGTADAEYNSTSGPKL
jgi:tetratricopeptide (TPR) repeat protein